MFELGALDKELSSLLSDEMIQPLIRQMTTMLFVTAGVSLLLLIAAIWFFGVYLPRKRKQELAEMINGQFALMSKKIESIYALRLEELAAALDRQTSVLEEAVAALQERKP